MTQNKINHQSISTVYSQALANQRHRPGLCNSLLLVVLLKFGILLSSMQGYPSLAWPERKLSATTPTRTSPMQRIFIIEHRTN